MDIDSKFTGIKLRRGSIDNVDEIAKPIPRVFKAQISNAYASKMTFGFVAAMFASLELGTILYRLFSRSFVALALPLTITTTVLIVWRLKVGGKTKARIEVCGNDIYSFDDLGNLAVAGDMREIAAVYRSSLSNPNSFNDGYSVDNFQVLFRNGTLITFHELFDSHFMLLKILHVRTGVDPERVPWTKFQMLELESVESRAHRACEPKALT